MLLYAFALIPLYVLVWGPLSQIIYGRRSALHEPLNLNSSLIASDEPLFCPEDSYKTFIISREPLMIYVEGFLKANESKHLVDVSEPLYEPSTVSHGQEVTVDTSVRNSEVAVLERDEVVRCIEHRARAFQGWRGEMGIEKLRTQRYGVGGHYGMHFDWSGGKRGIDRISTFMVYVDVSSDIKGGGTEFPRIVGPKGGRWEEFLDTTEALDPRSGKNVTVEGVTFKPIKGNAVFWENTDRAGRGYEETWHAGLPVEKGSKVGLNIWSYGRTIR
ncbi:hypothetical protein BHYA_0126g00010 [Botrytis hyacinthi]|uniref:Fe2OG dioxygenase domain-containing protein n=1 Tax=Botrytis hyacinthi TaxID=278943 RepID=A0A4Z1GI37_9HELO|nr:hypothetical protein BHYA_0126g00010 [Botrytis hyacinthi]